MKLLNVLLLLALLTCTYGVELKFGVIMPFVAYPVLGPGTLRAVKVAAHKIEQDNTLLPGTTFKILEWDDNVNLLAGVQGAMSMIDEGIVGIVGSLYSSISQPISLVMSVDKLPICSPGSTSPTLSDKTNYPYFFRAIPNDNIQGVAAIDFIAKMGWTKIAILAATDSYGQGLALVALQRCAEKNITVLLTQSFQPNAPDFSHELELVKKSQARIIIAFANTDDDVVLIEGAEKLGMLDPMYVWIGTEDVSLVSKFQSEDKMDLIKGRIFTQAQGIGIGYNDMVADWNNYFNFMNLTIPEISEYDTFAYDCFLTMIHGYKKILQMNSTFTMDDIVNRRLGDYLSFSTFNFPDVEGSSGPLTYDASGDRAGIMTIFNVQGNEAPVIATWYQDVITMKDIPILFADGTEKVPLDSTPLVVIDYTTTEGIIMTVLTILMIIYCLCILIFLTIFRNHFVVKAASYFFCVLIIIGGILLSTTVFTLIGDVKDNPPLCYSRMWVMALGFGLMFSNLIGKTYRIYRIFDSKDFKVIIISNWELLLYTSIVLILEIVLLIAWTIAAPLVPILDPVTNASYICDATPATAQISLALCWLLIAVNLGITVFGAYMAIQTRHVRASHKESKYIGFTIYNVLVLSIVVLPIETTPGLSPVTRFLVLSLVILAVVGFTVSILFVPKILIILKDQKEGSGSGNGKGSGDHKMGSSSSFTSKGLDPN